MQRLVNAYEKSLRKDVEKVLKGVYRLSALLLFE